MRQLFFNIPVEDYVEKQETAHVSTSTYVSSATCTRVCALVEDFADDSDLSLIRVPGKKRKTVQ